MRRLIAALLVGGVCCGGVAAATGEFTPKQLRAQVRVLDHWIDSQIQPGVNNCRPFIVEGYGWLLVQLVCQEKMAVPR